MKKLTAPANYNIIQNDVTFSVSFKLVQSRERDWAPYDLVQVMIQDDALMIIDLAQAKTAALVEKFAKEKTALGLKRHPESHEILARRAQQTLF
jgi:hypothetical protein